MRKPFVLPFLGALALAAACGGTGNEAGEDGQGGSESAGPGAGGSGTAGASSGAAGSFPQAGSGTGNAAGSGEGGFATGGTGGGTGGKCAGISQNAQAKVLPADIIWAIDTSGSMSEETGFVRSKMNAFAKGILDVGIDVHVVLVAEHEDCSAPIPSWCTNPLFVEGICIAAPLGSGKCPADTNLPVFRHVDKVVASTDGMLVIKDTYPEWKPSLRTDATKRIIMITDDNATSPPYDPASNGSPDAAAKKWIDDLKALDPAMLSQVKVDAIYSFTKCATAASVGDVWAAAVTQTGGVKGDLCKQDFQPVFNEIVKGVIASSKLDCAWKIPPAPMGMSFDKSKVNVKFTAGGGAQETILFAQDQSKCDPVTGGWYYDVASDPKTILACPATCKKIQADTMGKIDVELGCETQVIDPK